MTPGPSEAWAEDEGLAAALAAVDLPVQSRQTIAPETPLDAGKRMYDPYEEFARLAGEQVLANAVPRRRSNRPSTASPAASPPCDAAPSDQGAESGPTEAESTAQESSTPGFAGPATSEPEPPGPAEPELHFPTPSSREDWPIGERRSFARQARKPLPAALQAVVASDISQTASDEVASQPVASRQPAEPNAALLGAGVAGAEPGKTPVTAKKPGVIRRYASAIAIVVLFVAAGGAAAGIAAFRGPTRPGLTNLAREQAAADSIVLRAGDFPPPWRVTGAKVTPGSYGVASGIVTPALLRSWLVAHPTCATDVDSVSAALTASDGAATAVASTQAAASDPLGGSWQTTDVVAFHANAAQVRTDLASLRSLIAEPAARSCINRFWSASMLAGLPSGSHISLSVSQALLPGLPGDPPAWTMAMGGTAVVRGMMLPFRFEVTSFLVGHAQVSFTASSKLAPLPLSLDQALLVELATRADLQTS